MKWLKWMLGLLAILVVAFFYINTVMINDAERMSGFKESDWWLYRFYVDEDIKGAPRISDNFYFEFRRMDGPSPEMSGIVFKGTTETAALEKYLTALGYHHVSNDEIGQRWEKEDRPVPCIYIWRDLKGNIISLTKYSL